MRKNTLLLITALAALASSSACTPTVMQRGNMLEAYQIEQVVIGVHSRTDILRILGSPTTIAPFDGNIWYYMGQETEKRGILDPAVTKEKIYTVRFDDTGTVTSLEQIDQDRINIPVARDKTPTHGNDITILQEFLGNLGRFTPNQGGAPGNRGAPRN